MPQIIDPYGSNLVEDYTKVIKQFGLEPFDLDLFPDANKLMRRGIVFAGRDMKIISKCIKEKKPFYVLTGIMPSGEKIHFGTKSVIEQVKYFQQKGAHTYVLVADMEAMATRGISLEEARERALNFHIPAYIALGLDPKKTTFYFQSDNKEVLKLAYFYSQKVTANEFKAIYGSVDAARVMAALTQVGDILYPQTKERMPGIVPVGVDQDPHMRLTRDLVNRTKTLKYFTPSSIYHKFMPALNGGLKMSKSSPESNLELPMDNKTAEKRIKRAVTGGRETLELHRKLGAEVEKCMVFELLKQHLIENDKELDEIYNKYKKGEMTSGEIKVLAVEKMNEFLNDFNKKLEEARKIKPKLIEFS